MAADTFFSGSRGRYRVLRSLSARDGVTVYLARVHPVAADAPDSEALVAIKAAATAAASVRLEHEFRALRELAEPGHPLLCPPVDQGAVHGLTWLAMFWLDGPSLTEWATLLRYKGETPSREFVRSMVGDLAGTLAYAHSRGWVHADIAPSNILLSQGRPRLIDWAAAETAPKSKALLVRPSAGNSTPGYIAPERILGEAWDTRADVYALGCLWYELLALEPVFQAADAEGLARLHVHGAVPALDASALGVPPQHLALLQRMLAKDPHSRPASMVDVAHALADGTALSQSYPASQGQPLFESRLYGRTEVWAAIQKRIRATSEGRAQSVLLLGESGSGRTRLLSDAAQEATRCGLTVVDLETLDGSSATSRSAALELLLSEAPPGLGWLLLLDNAEQAEDWSALNATLASSSYRQRGMLLAASIELREATGSPAAALLLSLPPLSREATRRMMSDILACTIQEDLFRTVWRSSHGLPALVRSKIERLTRSGALRRGADGQWTIAPGAIDSSRPVSLPPLAEQEVSVLGAAAVLGIHFAESALQELLLAAGGPLPAEVSGLLSAQKLAELLCRQDAPGRWAFIEESTQAAAEALLGEAKLAELHQLRAEQLMSVDPARAGEHWARAGDGERAVKCYRLAAALACRSAPPDFPRAARCQESAYAQARAQSAVANATRKLAVRLGYRLLVLLSRIADHNSVHNLTRELLELSDDGHPLLEARGLRLDALSYRIKGQHADAVRQLDAAWLRLQQLTDSAEGAAAHERVLNRLDASWAYYANHQGQEAQSVARSALTLARRCHNPVELAEVQTHLAKATALRRRYAYSPRVIRLERSAVAQYDPLTASAAGRISAQCNLAFMLVMGRGEDAREGVEIFETALRHATSTNDTTLATRVTAYLAIGSRRLGNLDECQEHAARALELGHECGQFGYIGVAHACSGWVAYRRGGIAEARARLGDALQCWQRRRVVEPSRLSEYPFQWLALLPLLTLGVEKEEPARLAQWSEDLSHPTQARLCTPVHELIEQATARGSTWDMADWQDWANDLVPPAVAERYL